MHADLIPDTQSLLTRLAEHSSVLASILGDLPVPEPEIATLAAEIERILGRLLDAEARLADCDPVPDAVAATW